MTTARSVAAAVARRRRFNRAVIETLETRRLMDLTIMVQDSAGNSSAVVTHVGQVLNLQIVADVSNPSYDYGAAGVWAVIGEFKSSGKSGSVQGNLAAANYGAYQGSGSQPGVSQDFTGDGNLDVGESNANDFSQDFQARIGTVPTGNPVLDLPNDLVQIGTLTYTVTSLGDGLDTTIGYQEPTNAIRPIASWEEHGQQNTTSSFDSDPFSPFTISAPSAIPPPVAVNDTASAYPGIAPAIDILSNDIAYAAINASSLAIVSNGHHGTAFLSGIGGLSPINYFPQGGFIGTDSFTYDVSDVDGRVSNPATVTVTVYGTPIPPPTATAVSATTTQSVAIDIDVLNSDIFPDLNSGPPVINTAPAHGTVTVDPYDGSITYTPTEAFVGTDTFQYTVSDKYTNLSGPGVDGATSAPGTVTVTVEPTPPSTTAVDDTAAVVENSSAAINVTANDTTTTGTIDPATVEIITGPTHGTAAVQTDTGAVVYTPETGYLGPDRFTYRVKNSLGLESDTATAALTVVTASPPLAIPDSATTAQSGATTIDVATNDIPSADGGLDVSTITITTPPTQGTAVVTAGQIIYTPAMQFSAGSAGQNGSDSFDYTIGDGHGSQSQPAEVDVTILNPTPAGGGGTQNVSTGSSLLIDPAAGVTTGGVPIAANGTAVTIAPVYGTASVDSSTGMILYTPAAGFVGVDSVTFTVANTTGETSDPITETINVGATLSSAGRGRRSVSFVDAAGGGQTVALSGPGTAAVYFTGAGFEAALRHGVGSLEIESITLAGTTARSVLSVRGSTADPVRIRDITDADPLGAIAAPSAVTPGGYGSTFALAAVGSVQILSLSQTTVITTGGLKTPVVFNIGTGTDSSISTGQTIRSFTAGTWQPGAVVSNYYLGNPSITAPVIDSMRFRGAFNGSVTARQSAGSLIFGGGLTGTVTAMSVGLIEVRGSTYYHTLIAVGTAKSIVVTGDMDNSFINSVGNVGSITAGFIHDSTFGIGGLSDPQYALLYAFGNLTLSNVSAGALGSATLGSLKLTSRTHGGIQNSSIFAGSIGLASVGVIATGDNGYPQGIAADHIGSVRGIFSGKPFAVPANDLMSVTKLTAYFKAQGYALGDFAIDVVT